MTVFAMTPAYALAPVQPETMAMPQIVDSIPVPEHRKRVKPPPCSCMLYARTKMPHLPHAGTPANLKPNTTISVGAAVLLRYNLPHIAIVEEIRETGFLVSEKNYSDDPACPTEYRFIAYSDPHIRGFYMP